MPLQLDHTIVPAHDKVKSAKFIARMFGLKYEGPWADRGMYRYYGLGRRMAFWHLFGTKTKGKKGLVTS